jgi:hypothetical protein
MHIHDRTPLGHFDKLLQRTAMDKVPGHKRRRETMAPQNGRLQRTVIRHRGDAASAAFCCALAARGR